LGSPVQASLSKKDARRHLDRLPERSKKKMVTPSVKACKERNILDSLCCHLRNPFKASSSSRPEEEQGSMSTIYKC